MPKRRVSFSEQLFDFVNSAPYDEVRGVLDMARAVFAGRQRRGSEVRSGAFGAPGKPPDVTQGQAASRRKPRSALAPAPVSPNQVQAQPQEQETANEFYSLDSI